MNRIKVWVFTLLVVVAGAGALVRHSLDLRAAATANLDALLAGAAAQVASSIRHVDRETGAVAALTARDEGLVAALNPREKPAAKAVRRGKGAPVPAPASPPADPAAAEAALAQAARAALDSVEKTFGFQLPGTTVVTAGNREWLASKGPPSAAEGEGMGFMRAAIDGNVRRGLVRLSQKLWYGAASPSGQGAGLMLLVPLDEAWAKDLASAAGVDLTISVPDVKPVTTAAGRLDAAGATARPGTPVDVGHMGKVAVAVGPVKLPPFPLVSGKAPAARARAFALDGVKKGFVILSAPTGKAFAGIVRTEWVGLAALVLVLAAGIVLGFLVRGGPVAAAAGGDLAPGPFDQERAPAAEPDPMLGDGGPGLMLGDGGPGSAPELGGGFPDSAPPGAPFESAPEPEPGGGPEAAPVLGGGPFEAAPASAAPAEAPAAPAAPADDEDAHWQEVFQDFIRTREQCGEQSEGLTYERFKVKLESNKAQLVAKYSCRTVRFQVYVKEGKAALKATPIR